MKCSQCGQKVEKDEKICKNCGQKQEEQLLSSNVKKRKVAIAVGFLVIFILISMAAYFVPRIFYVDLETIEKVNGPKISEMQDNDENVVMEEQVQEVVEERIAAITPYEDKEKVTYVKVESNKEMIYGIGRQTYQMYEYLSCEEGQTIDNFAGSEDGRYLFYSICADNSSKDNSVMCVKSYDNSFEEQINIRATENGFRSFYVFQNQYLVVYGDNGQGMGWYLYDVLNANELIFIGHADENAGEKAASQGNGFAFWGEEGLYYYEVGKNENAKCLVETEEVMDFEYVNEEDLSIITYIQNGNAYCIINQQPPIYYGNAKKVIYADKNTVVCDNGMYKDGELYTLENTPAHYEADYKRPEYNGFSEIVAYDKEMDVAYVKLLRRNDIEERTYIHALFTYENSIYIGDLLWCQYEGDSGNVMFAEDGYIYTRGNEEALDSEEFIEAPTVDMTWTNWDNYYKAYYEEISDEEIGSVQNWDTSTVLNEGKFYLEDRIEYEGDVTNYFPLSKGGVIIEYCMADFSGPYYRVYYPGEDNVFLISNDTMKHFYQINFVKEIEEDVFLVGGDNVAKIIDNQGNIIQEIYDNDLDYTMVLH